MLSFKLINNQDLVLISRKGIFIFTINEDGIRLRYFWNNDEWNDIYKKFFVKFIEKHGEIHDNNFTNFTNKHYKPLIGRILKNEFDDSKHSIPLQKFIDEWDKKEIIEYVINDKFVSPKFGTEMLKIAIKKKCHDAVRQIIGSNQGYSENYMTIISLNLAELCDYYSDYIITYILRTSIMLSPYCNIIGNSKNTSLHSHVIYIKESNMDNIIFKFISELYNGLIRSNSINDDNDPQNLATKYDFVNPDGIITNTTIIQDPDPNTNLFNWFPTSLLAVYNLLTGDSGSLSSFTYPIDDFNKKEEFLLQKVQIIISALNNTSQPGLI
ncbi:unnamed protein product [Rhizophagus irregularis]|nr:unnamed protein product [Rhizophagus irregularis]